MPAKHAERDRAMFIEFLSGAATRKDLAKKHGISYTRILYIIDYQKKLAYRQGHIKINKIVGVLIDPDGIDGSVLQEWTPEQQWKEFEVSDGHCG